MTSTLPDINIEEFLNSYESKESTYNDFNYTIEGLLGIEETEAAVKSLFGAAYTDDNNDDDDDNNLGHYNIMDTTTAMTTTTLSDLTPIDTLDLPETIVSFDIIDTLGIPIIPPPNNIAEMTDATLNGVEAADVAVINDTNDAAAEIQSIDSAAATVAMATDDDDDDDDNDNDDDRVVANDTIDAAAEIQSIDSAAAATVAMATDDADDDNDNDDDRVVANDTIDAAVSLDHAIGKVISSNMYYYCNLIRVKKASSSEFLSKYYMASSNVNLTYCKKVHPVKKWIFEPRDVKCSPIDLIKINDADITMRVHGQLLAPSTLLVRQLNRIVAENPYNLTYSDLQLEPLNVGATFDKFVASHSNEPDTLENRAFCNSIYNNQPIYSEEIAVGKRGLGSTTNIELNEQNLSFFNNIEHAFIHALKSNQKEQRIMLSQFIDCSNHEQRHENTFTAAIYGHKNIPNKNLIKACYQYVEHLYIHVSDMRVRHNNSFYFMHSGGVRIYLFVDHEYFPKLGQLTKSQDLKFVMSQTLLNANKIPYDICVQRPGEVVVIKKNVYYVALNIGTCAFEYIKHCDIDEQLRYQLECFTHAKTLDNIATDGNSQIFVIRKYTPTCKSVCPVCNKRFLHSNFLNNHMTIFHSSEKIKCSTCGVLMADDKTKEIHKSIHVIEKMPCLICNKLNKFTHISLRRHYKEVHKTIVTDDHFKSLTWLQDYIKLASAIKNSACATRNINTRIRIELFSRVCDKTLPNDISEIEKRLLLNAVADDESADSDDDDNDDAVFDTSNLQLKTRGKKRSNANNTNNSKPKNKVSRLLCDRCDKMVNNRKHLDECMGCQCPRCLTKFFSQKNRDIHMNKGSCKKK